MDGWTVEVSPSERFIQLAPETARRRHALLMTTRDDASDETVTVAIMTAILYAARFQRRVPESDAEKLQTVGQVIDYIKAKAGSS